MSELRIGVAGLGHGRTLLGANDPQGRDLPMRVTALCEKRPKLLESIAREYGINQATTEYDELVARDDLDIIGIYTPGPLHSEQILKALDAGKHVMVTKSMVYTMAEVEAVVEAVDRSGLVLLVTQTMRGRYDLMEAKRACDAGEIGELFLGEAHYIHDLRPVYDYSPWRLTMPQDLILGGACHPIDLLRWFSAISRRCTVTACAAAWPRITPRKTTSSSACASPAGPSAGSPPSWEWCIPRALAASALPCTAPGGPSATTARRSIREASFPSRNTPLNSPEAAVTTARCR